MLFSPPPRDQQEFPPLLFALTPAAEGPQPATPRTTPLRTNESSMSTQRRTQQTTTPGSVHTEATPPPPPPPVLRLSEDIVMDEPSTSAPQAGYAQQSPLAANAGMGMNMGAQSASSMLMQQQWGPQYDDVWVTVFGFSQTDVPLILSEFSKCGDILQWGTFGQPQANFLHICYQNKYGAQRALARAGEQLTPALIVGVKPLDPRHRQAIQGQGYDAGAGAVMPASAPVAAAGVPSWQQAGAGGAPGLMMDIARPLAAPERPYRLQASNSSQQMPQQNRSMFSKVTEYVFGL